jgi:hypothetical protein
MSAAEPADPTMPASGEQGDMAAVIIDISTRTSRRSERGRRKPVSDLQPGHEPSGGPSVQQQLAEHFETTFNHHHLSLTDDITKTAFAVTLEIVRGMLHGAQAQGIIDAEQRTELDAMIKGMASAPKLVERSV